MRPLNPDESTEPLTLAVRSSREAALRVLEEHRETGMWVSDLLDRVFRETRLPASERGLATELACGIVRRQGTLDAILKSLVARPANQVEVSLWTILRIGVYQIMMLDGVPSHAAVHETVELCKRAGRMRWSGFVNGVLRGATRLVTGEFQTSPSSSAIPIDQERHRQLVKPVFPDPQADFVGYLAAAYSYPRWLIERWSKRYDRKELIRICGWYNSPPSLVVRANSLRSDTETMVSRFQDAGVTVTPLQNTECLMIQSDVRVDELPGYDEGLFAIQDYSASCAAVRLAPKPGQRVWDVCAAPGGKSCHLAAIMQNEGEVLATDIRSDRLRMIDMNAHRLGAKIIRTNLVDEPGRRMPDGPFDAILIDVPCSNTGVLAKRPEARWRITEHGLQELSEVQARLLRQSLERLPPGGRLVYSTCSIETSENEDLVRRVLKTFPKVRIVEEETFVPGRPADGAYQALLVSE